MLADLANHLVRAVQLLALTVAPQGFSPEPVAPENPILFGLLAAGLLAGILYFAVWFRRDVDTAAARASAALLWVAVAGALLVPIFVRGDAGPLARGVVYLAVPVWAALALTASTAAGQYLGSSFKNRRMGALVIVLGAGALQFANAAALYASRDKMWRDALKRDISNEAAINGVTRALVRSYKYDDARKVADRCLAAAPEACGCLEARARLAADRVANRCLAPQPAACSCQNAADAAVQRAQQLDLALADARAAVAACPERALSRAILAEVLALRGENAEAEEQANAGLGLGGKGEDRLHYALALTQQAQGKYDDAEAELKLAIKAGAGRDAKLLAGAIALMKDDLDGAERTLKPLVGTPPRDPVAAYNLALVADRRGVYNAAREGYLNTLRADPCYATARYNLAQLTWKAGIQEEARHHARKYAEGAAPGDPLVVQLSALVGEQLIPGKPAP